MAGSYSWSSTRQRRDARCCITFATLGVDTVQYDETFAPSLGTAPCSERIAEAEGGPAVTHNENETPHPAIHHHREAAAHLRKAAVHLDHALGYHEKGAHATAGEAAKMAAGHISEAQA